MSTILVIPDMADFWDDVDDFTEQELLKKYHIDPLLTEFKGEVIRNKKGQYIVPLSLSDIPDLPEKPGQEYRVLILEVKL